MSQLSAKQKSVVKSEANDHKEDSSRPIKSEADALNELMSLWSAQQKPVVKSEMSVGEEGNTTSSGASNPATLRSSGGCNTRIGFKRNHVAPISSRGARHAPSPSRGGHSVSLSYPSRGSHSVSLSSRGRGGHNMSLSSASLGGHNVSLSSPSRLGHSVSLSSASRGGHSVSSKKPSIRRGGHSVSSKKPSASRGGHSVSLSSASRGGHSVSLSSGEDERKAHVTASKRNANKPMNPICVLMAYGRKALPKMKVEFELTRGAHLLRSKENATKFGLTKKATAKLLLNRKRPQDSLPYRKSEEFGFRVFMNRQEIATGYGADPRRAKQATAANAIEILEKQNASCRALLQSIRNKNPIVLNEERAAPREHVIELADPSKSRPLDDGNRGGQMMRRMGWNGGGLGRGEQGPRQLPAVLLKRQHGRCGLGFIPTVSRARQTKDFCKGAKERLIRFLNSDETELQFSSSLSKRERTVVHGLCESETFDLSHREVGKGAKRAVVVRKRCAQTCEASMPNTRSGTEKAIARFLNSDETELQLPGSPSKADRAVLHRLCQTYALYHREVGKGAERAVIVQKRLVART